MTNNIFQKLKKYLNTLSSKRSNKEISPISGNINFILYENNEIDIITTLPECDSLTEEAFLNRSENFGKFISIITSGLASEQIVKLLDNAKKNSKSSNSQLFIDNILYFWAINYVEYIKNKKKKNKLSPIIKPTAVFGQTKSLFD